MYPTMGVSTLETQKKDTHPQPFIYCTHIQLHVMVSMFQQNKRWFYRISFEGMASTSQISWAMIW
jgi:hypothetical protein